MKMKISHVCHIFTKVSGIVAGDERIADITAQEQGMSSQFDLGRPFTFSRVQQSSCFRIIVFYVVRAGEQKVCEWGPKIWKI